jgi:hypothetical protein
VIGFARRHAETARLAGLGSEQAAGEARGTILAATATPIGRTFGRKALAASSSSCAGLSEAFVIARAA